MPISSISTLQNNYKPKLTSNSDHCHIYNICFFSTALYGNAVQFYVEPKAAAH